MILEITPKVSITLDDDSPLQKIKWYLHHNTPYYQNKPIYSYLGDLPPNKKFYHINKDRYDFRRANLRIVNNPKTSWDVLQEVYDIYRRNPPEDLAQEYQETLEAEYSHS